MATMWDVLKAPVITEKAMAQKENSTKKVRDSKHKRDVVHDSQLLTFRVAKGANKHSIKAAVEKIFNVKVAAVRVVNVHGKSVRRGRIEGRRPDWRKAYVTLKSGFNVDYADSI